MRVDLSYDCIVLPSMQSGRYIHTNCLAKDGFLSPMRALDILKWKSAVVSLSQASARDWKLEFIVGIQLSQLKSKRSKNNRSVEKHAAVGIFFSAAAISNEGTARCG